MATMMDVKGLCKRFQTSKSEITALHDVNFRVRQGEFLAVIGPSGCGKTTLLRCIAGLESPSLGEIRINDRPVTGPGTDRMMVFQDFNQLFPWLTVRDNILFPLKIVHKGKNNIERKVLAEYYLELVGLADYGHMYPHQLSGGMKQRVTIARALALSPKVLLMDEPFGSLDAITRTNLQEELLNIWEKTGVTIIFVTHNIEEAIMLADRIMVLKSGRVEKLMVNTITRPRYYDTPEFTSLWEDLHNLLQGRREKEKLKGEIKKEVGLAF